MHRPVASPLRAFAKRMLAPVERFLAIEAASGIVLAVATAAALFWANSRWAGSYHAFFELHFARAPGQTLRFAINDGLMTIFFFVVGLEIRRELHDGELSELRRAALPLAAAVGGMLVPAAIYWGLNHGRVGAAGWGIPMATDIAFAVGILALLGSRVAPALRVFLLALAVIDDIGAIVVIAVFYAHGFDVSGLLIAGGGILGILLMQRADVRRPLAYLVPAAVVWLGIWRAGVHPTLAGVVVGLMAPRRAWFVEHELHRWVAFGIMPSFAFANAGVTLAGAPLAGDALRVALGVGLGLVVGKTVGVVGAAWLATRLGAAVLPRGVTLGGVVVVGLTAGVGFTMALFVTGLAFPAGPLAATAKLAIFAASLTAALLGLGLGRAILVAPGRGSGAARSEHEAETSTQA